MSKSTPKWPNLFLVGAPRSGTTTLHEMLDRHPDIFMSKVKEPNYFSTPPIPERHRQVLGATQDKKEYLSLFNDASDQKYIGEGTTHYLSDYEAPKRIHSASPNAKIIAIIRNPIDRAYSAFLLLGRRGGNGMTFYETMKKQIADDKNKNTFGNFAVQGQYSKLLDNFYKYFDKKQVLVLSFDDLRKNPTLIKKQLANFLEVPIEGFSEDKVEKNAYQEPRNTFTKIILQNSFVTKYAGRILPKSAIRFFRNKVFLKQAKKQPMDEQSKKLLENYFADELQNFDSLLSKNQ